MRANAQREVLNPIADHLTFGKALVIVMAMNSKPTLTELLRTAMAASGRTVRQIARDTGLNHGSLLRFRCGRQSLRLDLAERLAAYFEIESRPVRRRKGA